MPTELLTLNQERAQQVGALTAGRGPSELTTLRSQQRETVRFDDVSFDEVLEAFNPLDHIPVISSLREVSAAPTAQEEANPLTPIAKMLTGGLFGGMFGLVTAAIDAVFSQENGQGLFGTLISSAVEGDSGEAAHSPALQRAALAYQPPQKAPTPTKMVDA
jgi:hypothetical protein